MLTRSADEFLRIVTRAVAVPILLSVHLCAWNVGATDLDRVDLIALSALLEDFGLVVIGIEDPPLVRFDQWIGQLP
jgi:hypothetical protein